MLDLQSFIAAVSGTGLLGAVVFAIRQEGRINTHDKLFEEREKLANERHADLKNDLKEIKETLLQATRSSSPPRQLR